MCSDDALYLTYPISEIHIWSQYLTYFISEIHEISYLKSISDISQNIWHRFISEVTEKVISENIISEILYLKFYISKPNIWNVVFISETPISEIQYLKSFLYIWNCNIWNSMFEMLFLYLKRQYFKFNSSQYLFRVITTVRYLGTEWLFDSMYREEFWNPGKPGTKIENHNKKSQHRNGEHTKGEPHIWIPYGIFERITSFYH